MRAWTAALLPTVMLFGAAEVYGQRTPLARGATRAQAPVAAQPSPAVPRGQTQWRSQTNDSGRGYGGIRGGGSHQYGHSHHPHGHNSGYYNPGYGGYGYGGIGAYGGFSLGVPGYGFNQYVGPSYWGPLINPPVYAFPPYGGFGYGVDFGYGPSIGYGTSIGASSYPLNNQLMQEAYNNDWARLSAEMADRAVRNVAEPGQGASTIPVPSSPEAKIKSLRYQSQGDEAFRDQEFNRAFERYRLAGVTAKDNGSAWMRAGYALVALGRYSVAAEYFKKAIAADPSIAVTGPAPEELYGDNLLAWNSHLGGATLWVREDVRDPQRVFLLGTLLYFDGDTRAPEFLERAYQLSGGSEEAVLTLLNPPEIVENAVGEAAPAEELPAEPDIDALLDETIEGPALAAPNKNIDSMLEEETGPRSKTFDRTAPPLGWTPQFPLPSEQNRNEKAEAIPPLPAPEEN